MEPITDRSIYKSTPIPKAQGTLQRNGWKTVRARKPKNCCEIVSASNGRSCSLKVYPCDRPNMNWSKTNRGKNMIWEKPVSSQPYWQIWNAGRRKSCLLQRRIWIVYEQLVSLKIVQTYIQVTVYRRYSMLYLQKLSIIYYLSAIYLSIIYTYYTYMNVAIVNESTVNEFESQQGWVYGRIWRQEMKGRNDANINSELKLKKISCQMRKGNFLFDNHTLKYEN